MKKQKKKDFTETERRLMSDWISEIKKNEILKKENEKLIALSNRTCPDVWNENIKLLYDVTQKDAVIELLKKENEILKNKIEKLGGNKMDDDDEIVWPYVIEDNDDNTWPYADDGAGHFDYNDDDEY